MSPSRPLREEVIEAGAARIWNDLPRYELMYPECERIARHALDAFLNTLEERSDEWTDAAYPNSHPALHTVRSMTARRFLAVLREGDE